MAEINQIQEQHVEQFIDDHVEDEENEGVPNSRFSGESRKMQNPRDLYSTITHLHDHFTLPIPSSTIQFEDSSSAARIISTPGRQFVLEETQDPKTNKHKVTIKQMEDVTTGLMLLRLMYTLVCVVFTGFLFVFNLQLILYVVLDAAIQLVPGSAQHGESEDERASFGLAIGSILAVPVMVRSFSSALVIASHYIVDTWNGHYLVKNFVFGDSGVVAIEWIFFWFFLGLPLTVMWVTLMVGTDDWWLITSLFWLGCVGLFFVLFAVSVIVYEVATCWEVIQNYRDDDIDTFFACLKRAILMTEMYTLGGYESISYVSRGTIKDIDQTTDFRASALVTQSKGETNTDVNNDNITFEEQKEILKKKITDYALTKKSQGLYTNFTFLLAKCGLFERLQEAKPVYFVEDAQDMRPFITSKTWGLEKLFCRNKNSRYVGIIRGSDAISPAQIRSTIFCSVTGIILTILIIASFFIYMDLDAATVSVLTILAIIFSTPFLFNIFRIYVGAKDLLLYKDSASANRDINQDDDSEGVYLMKRYFRLTQPTELFCWTVFLIKLALLFFWPLVSLFSFGSHAIGGLFMFVTGVNLMRYYINASIVLKETGSMEYINGTEEKERWQKQARLNSIIGNITESRANQFWTAFFSLFAVVYVALAGVAFITGADVASSPSEPYTYVHDFYYPTNNMLQYPTCPLGTVLLPDAEESISIPISNMADYVFLANTPYMPDVDAQLDLHEWFRDQGAVNNPEIVRAFRENNADYSPVHYQLITFPEYDNFAVVAIRGTDNTWDMLIDAQLWMTAVQMQALRALLPFGNIWTPAMTELNYFISFLKTESIRQISFYKQTSAFVEYLVESGNYSAVHVTGHSLGGGIAIITGARTGVPAVALSGPNAMLSRHAFEITPEQINKNTFNIVPERDVVAMIDDVGRNHQTIKCTTPLNDIAGCHTSFRSLCEVLYTCGSSGRPVPCECVTVYNYPEPKLSKDSVFMDMPGMPFLEACRIAKGRPGMYLIDGLS